MSEKPCVSVIMSVYNGESYLIQAIESVLSQTFKDFEFVIINDGSTDRTAEILDSYISRDSRIRVIHQDNIGLTRSLNKAIRIANGCLIARMDSDDVSLPSRIEKQVEFLCKNPDHIGVGTSGVIIDGNGTKLSPMCLTADADELRLRFLANNYMIHGSVVFRKNLDLIYDESIRYAQDYDLWVRMISVSNLANLQECLYLWRQHSDGISERKKLQQQSVAKEVASRHLKILTAGGRFDVILKFYLTRIVPVSRLREIKTHLLKQQIESPEMMRQCKALILSSEYHFSGAIADFPLWTKFLSIGPSCRKLVRVFGNSARRRVKRLLRSVSIAFKSLVDNQRS